MVKATGIVAIGPQNIIGVDGNLPWHFPEDLQRFRTLTLGRIVVVGRKTYESLPAEALYGRIYIVLSRALPTKPYPPGVVHCRSVEEVLLRTENTSGLVIAGGAQIYKAFNRYINEWCITEVAVLPTTAGVEDITRMPFIDFTWWHELESPAARDPNIKFRHYIRNT